MNKPVLLSISLLFSCLLISQVSAQLSVDSVSGTLAHGQAITISGSGFGEKNPAAPLLWDDAEDKTVNSDSAVEDGDQVRGGYDFSDVWPNQYDGGGGYWNMRYRSFPFTPTENIGSISAPHSRSTKCLAGGHCADSYGCRDVGVTIDSGVTSGNTRWFVMFYHRTTMPIPGSDHHHKWLRFQSGSIYLDGTTSYIEFASYDNPSYGYECCLPDYDCDRSCLKIADEWCGARTHTMMNDMPNPNLDWVHAEIQLLNEADAGSVFRAGADNQWAINHEDCTDVWDWNQRSFSLGDYYRYDVVDGINVYNDDAWRIYDDIYVDNSLARVILTDNQDYDSSTIWEPQIPSAWSDNSITVTTNLGKFPDTGTAYLFVFDADNEHNEDGFPVSLQGGGNQACPDSVCNGTETCYSCPSDCGDCCGNGNCESAYGETCSSCPSDCPTGSGQVCCSGVLYTGNCCDDSNCTSPETCRDHVCTPPCENDIDGDDYGTGANCLGPDCDDDNPDVHENITCPYNGSQCGTYDLCLETCPTLPAEICDNSLDDDCDELEDCNDDDCFSDPACQTGEYRCGTACSQNDGCTNNIIADSCSPSENCDGYNDVEDIILPASTLQAGSTVEVQAEYECYLGGSGTDQLVLWYYNTTGWRLLGTWSEGAGLDCDTLFDGADGTVSATFIVDDIEGTHYIRAIEAAADIATETCPDFAWGDIDDLAFTVTAYNRADTNQDSCIELSELLTFIDRWKISRQDVPMPEMMGAVGLWKSGAGCT